MRPVQRNAAVVLAVLLLAGAYGFYRTGDTPKIPRGGKGGSVIGEILQVDVSPLKSAQQFAQQVRTDDEVTLAKEALRLADYQVDLAYDAALHEVRQHPPALSAAAKEAKERLQKAEKLVADDEAQMAQLTAELAKVKDDDKKDKLQEQYDNKEADRDLASDEVEDAQEDFSRAGGDMQERLQEAQKQHRDAQQKVPVATAAASEQHGLIQSYRQWSVLHTMQLQLWSAKSDAESRAANLSVLHNTLDAKLETEKEKAPELAHHTKKSTVTSTPATPFAQDQRSADELAAAADRKWALAAEQEALSNYDKRIETNNQIAAVYANWIASVAEQQRSIVHRGLAEILVILGIVLVGIFFDRWLESLLGKTKMDRRQLETLRTVTRVTLQVLAVLFILLVILGLPSQVGTFLGLAGAGLTVALKDFIVGFIGWFVLMGKNGIRLGDWVEINGVTGEVVELGMFHTVLLETGNWTDSGHPTGRRVTFTNSFAIEGHYFNFSTSGQWLWDELQLVLPAGRDPYPIVDAIQKKVLEATAETAKLAEKEWQGVAQSRDKGRSLTAAPAINVKPVLGGIEIAVRYITRANERYQMRAKLNQAAVDLMGQDFVGAQNTPAAAVPNPS